MEGLDGSLDDNAWADVRLLQIGVMFCFGRSDRHDALVFAGFVILLSLSILIEQMLPLGGHPVDLKVEGAC